MNNHEPTLSLESVMLAAGYVAGGLTQPAIFMALVEDMQDGRWPPQRIVFLRDTLTRALQLAGVEPLEGPGA